MIKALETLFSSFGKILDIKAKRNIPHRGQAFISYATQELADKVKNELQGYELFGKKLDIQYAREESFAVSKEFGVLEEHKRKRKEIKAARGPKEKRIKSMEESMAHPNAILFVQHIPKDTTSEFLESLFRQFNGFKEVRMVPGKPDIAFVEYENERFSSVAKKTLHGYRINAELEIKVSFAKK
jgi:U2 small nuclear ribonucleoprotein B''